MKFLFFGKDLLFKDMFFFEVFFVEFIFKFEIKNDVGIYMK